MASFGNANTTQLHTTCPSGNSYLTGHFSDSMRLGSFTMFNPDSGTSRGFVAKYNSNGNCVWARTLGNRENFLSAIITDNSENIFVAGGFWDTLVVGNDTLMSLGAWDIQYCKLDSSGNLLWARRTGGDTSEYVYGIGLDTLENIFLTGMFSPSTSFGNINLNSAGGFDIFIVKMDSSGAPYWAVGTGGPLNQHLRHSRTDTYGNTYLTGQVINTTTFGSWTLQPTYGGNDVYVTKFDPFGNCSWAKLMGGPGQDLPRSVGYDSFGNVYITGNFTDSVYYGSFSLAGHGLADIYLAKYNANGVEKWINNVGGPAWDFSSDLVTDKIGNSYLLGYYRDWIMFTNDLPPLDTALAFSDIFVCKYDSNGAFQWFKTAAGHGWEDPKTIGIDAGSNTYIIGTYDSTCIFDPVDSLTNLNGGDRFIAKINNVVVMSESEYGIEQMNDLIGVYPNPSHGLYTIETHTLFEGEWRVTDISGRVLQSQSVPGTRRFQIDLSAEAKGMYFILLRGQGLSAVKKLIKY